MKKKTKEPRGPSARKLSAQDWRDIYDALMDAAEQHHSGPRVERILALARKVREGMP